MKITVVTPSLNQGRFIERTITSVLSQEFPNIEYIVLDGDSSDETHSILKKYSKQLQFISKKDNGQANALNSGLRMASGDIIGWLNSDDIYYPNTFHQVAAFFTAHPEVDVVYGKAHHITEDDEIINFYPTENWDTALLKNYCFLSQPAVFFRKKLLNQCGYLDESLHFCMDYEYWLRLSKQNVSFHYLNTVFAGSRLHADTKTISSPLQARLETMKMLHKKLSYVPEAWLLDWALTATHHKTMLRYPSYRYIVLALINYTFNAFRWNGLRGFWSCLSLLKVLKQKKRLNHKIETSRLTQK